MLNDDPQSRDLPRGARAASGAKLSGVLRRQLRRREGVELAGSAAGGGGGATVPPPPLRSPSPRHHFSLARRGPAPIVKPASHSHQHCGGAHRFSCVASSLASKLLILTEEDIRSRPARFAVTIQKQVLSSFGNTSAGDSDVVAEEFIGSPA